MNTENLGARLKAELARNKAKSSVLGVMCLVAAYFWVPLLGNWFGGDTSDELDVAAESAQPSDVQFDNEPAKAKTDQGKSLDWRTAVARLREKPLLGSIETFSLTRNPFADLSVPDVVEALEHEEETEQEETEQPVELPPEPRTFEELRLVLNGIMVGNHSRMATVNGKTYREGQEISVVTANDAGHGSAGSLLAEEKAVIKSIHSEYVVVSYDGRLYKLGLEPLMLSQNRSVGISRPLLNNGEE